MRDDRDVAIGLLFQPTPFIGRDAELTEIATILGDPGCHLLTLLGPGGVGKTRLALEVAARQSHAFADGVAFVALASVGAPNQGEAALGLPLGSALAGFWRIRGHQIEGRRWLDALLAAYPVPHVTRIAALYGAVALAVEQGDNERAKGFAEEALEIARAIGDTHWIAESLAVSGKIAFQEDIPRATALFEEALALFRNQGETRGVANMLLNLGRTALGQGHIAQATPLLAESLALYEQLGDPMGIIYVLLHQGAIAAIAEDADQATALGVAALQLAYSSEFLFLPG
jgi:tetratricopeptide (TPR) repeat protein